MFYILGILGLIISLYAYYVFIRTENKKYKPICDINSKMSCTKSIRSRYSRKLFVHNSLIGAAYYIIVILADIFSLYDLIFYISLIASVYTVYLAYINYVKLRNFCLLCTLTYIINFILLVRTYALVSF